MTLHTQSIYLWSHCSKPNVSLHNNNNNKTISNLFVLSNFNLKFWRWIRSKMRSSVTTITTTTLQFLCPGKIHSHQLWCEPVVRSKFIEGDLRLPENADKAGKLAILSFHLSVGARLKSISHNAFHVKGVRELTEHFCSLSSLQTNLLKSYTQFSA